MRKSIAILLIAAMMMLMVACGNSTAPTESGDDPAVKPPIVETEGEKTEAELDGEITFGFAIGVTGSLATEAERIQQTAKLACEKINANGGVLGKKLTFVVEDDQASADTAVTVAKMYGENSKIIAMVGAHMSSAALAISDTVTEYKLPTLYAGTSISTWELNNDYMFRFRPSDAVQATSCIKYAVEELGCSKIAVLYNNSDYGVGGKNCAEEYLKEKGMDWTVAEGHNSGEVDFTATLMKAKNAGCDGIFVWGYMAEASIISRQFKELGINENCILIGSSTFASTDYLNIVDEAVADGIYAVCDFVYTNPDNEEFSKLFFDTYGVNPDSSAGQYYDAVMILASAIERAGSTDRQAIADALRTTDGLTGHLGTFYSDGNGDLTH